MAMREKRGYWFDSRALEAVPIHDHYDWLSDLEQKFRFGFSRSEVEERWGASLGMREGDGWGPPPKGAKAKREFMLRAIKAGWVRIRGHSDMPRMTFEFWKKTPPMMAALAVAARKVAGTGETLELHEVATDTPWLVAAKDLMALAGEGGEVAPAAISGAQFLRELWGRAAENPRVYRRTVARGLHVRGNPFDHTEYENPAGEFSHGRCGTFTPDKPAMCYGGRFRKMPRLVSNPETFERYIRPEKGEGATVARFFVGLKRGLGRLKGRNVGVDEVVQYVKLARAVQLKGHLPGGASFVLQRGFFTDWEKQHLHPDEKSLQVLIYPEFGGGETLRSFSTNMRRLAMGLRRRFEQKAVILDLVVNGKQRFLGEAKWESKKG